MGPILAKVWIPQNLELSITLRSLFVCMIKNVHQEDLVNPKCMLHQSPLMEKVVRICLPHFILRIEFVNSKVLTL